MYFEICNCISVLNCLFEYIYLLIFICIKYYCKTKFIFYIIFHFEKYFYIYKLK